MLEYVVTLERAGCIVQPLDSLGKVYEPVPVLLGLCCTIVSFVYIPSGLSVLPPPIFLFLLSPLGTPENTNV